MTLMLVFPNFTEQPIFAQPGKTVDVKGDAYHRKELTVEGTKDNKLMNSFRRQTANASPPEALKYARQFILRPPGVARQRLDGARRYHSHAFARLRRSALSS